MKFSNTIKLFSCLLFFSLLTISCGDDPASANEDPPALPSFEDVTADVSFFEQNSSEANSESNFSVAYDHATGLSSVSFISGIYLGFFNPADQSEADFNNGEWIWEYSYNDGNESVMITLIAQEVGSNMVWEMNWSYDDGAGNSFEDYTMVEGTVALDGSSGSWTFNDMDPETNTETPYLVTTWERSGETNYESTTEIYNESGGVDTYTFTQNGEVFDVSYTSSDQQTNIYVHWETDVQTGYYQIGNDQGSRYCWDATFQDITCSDVGY